MIKLQHHLTGKLLLVGSLLLLPIAGVGGGLLDVVTNPFGSTLEYFTQPSIGNLDSMLDTRGRALILEASNQLDSVLRARQEDLDKWSKLTIDDAVAKIKLATNDAENNFDKILEESASEFEESLYAQQGILKRNVYYIISILQSSLLIVAAAAAIFAYLVHFGIRLTNKKRGKELKFWPSTAIIASIIIALIAAIRIGNWSAQRSVIKSERIELTKALNPAVRDFDLAAFRAKQIALLSSPNSTEEAEATSSAEKYAILQTFFNQRHRFRSKTGWSDFASRIKSAIQYQWVNGQKIDKDLMVTLAIITFDNPYRTRGDEFIGAQLAATALSASTTTTPLWESTFERPARAVITRYLNRPLVEEELVIFFPNNAQVLKENIPAIKVVNVEVLKSLLGTTKDSEESLSTLVRTHFLNTNALYFRVVDWNLHTPSNGGGPRNGQQQFIDDIEANHAAWIKILESGAYKSASIAEKLKLATLGYSIFARLADYKDSLKNNTLKQDIADFTCKSAIKQTSRDIIRSPVTRSADRQLPEPTNASTVVIETINFLIKDGSLSELSGFAMSRILEAATIKESESYYRMERDLYTSIRKPGDLDINCDLLQDNYTCPPQITYIEYVGFRASIEKPVNVCTPDEAKIKYTQVDIDSSLHKVVVDSATLGILTCTTEKCTAPQDYKPVFRLIQNRNTKSLKDIQTDDLYSLYTNARWVGTF